ncbi:MAG: hypothetical protein ACLP50_33975 [Solirubrobacteraceae bacterium]
MRIVEIGRSHLVVDSPSGRRYGISFDSGPDGEEVSVTELEALEPGPSRRNRFESVIWVIPRPGNRAGWEIWLGPVGLILTWPPQFPLDWNWGSRRE